MLLATATRPPTGADLGKTLLLLGLLIAVLILCGIAVAIYRRRTFSDQDTGQTGLLESLHQMRRDGHMSEQEYQAARKKLIDRLSQDKAPDRAPRVSPDKPDQKNPQTTPEPRSTADPSTRTAPPGYDLTGEPLPKPDPDAR